MTRYPCPYLSGDVELTDERVRHIAERHPELLPDRERWIAGTLVEPDQVRRSLRLGSATSFSRWYADLRQGKHAVVVVVSEPEAVRRHWSVTAYVAGRLVKGEVEWKRG